MKIRPAIAKDASAVAPLMFQAMEDIVYKLIGKEDKALGISFLEHLFEKEDNQYSYQNTIVYEEGGILLGSLVFYNGENLHRLREPVLSFVEEKFGQKHTNLEDETASGETYIDTLSVHIDAKGKGIGSRLIKYLIEYVDKANMPRIGLLVDENNPKAEKLYNRLGFTYLNTQNLAGGVYKHLVLG